MPSTPVLQVAFELPASLSDANAFADLCLRLIDRVLAQRLGPHTVLRQPDTADGGGTVRLALALGDTDGVAAGSEGFRVADGAAGRVVVRAPDRVGLLHGLGHVLRSGVAAAAAAGGTAFRPSAWRGVELPATPVRGAYFAFHFNNWYVSAPVGELMEYLEDLVLWGTNTLVVHLPHFYDGDTAQARASRLRDRTLLRRARDLGMKIGVLKCPNLGIGNIPPAAIAPPFPDATPALRGYSPNFACPNTPEGWDYLHRMLGDYLDAYADLQPDYAVSFPYDAGGCGCERCRPWAANGYLKLCRHFADLYRARVPHGKFVLGCWCLDVAPEPEGEWDGLRRAFAGGSDWVDYLMVDSHFEFPADPLEKGFPGNLPLLNFPEITMWGRYPWGGFGANPLPDRFQRIHDQIADPLRGGFPYSEGIFDDLNQIIWTRFYWSHQGAADTLRDYLAWEFAGADAAPILAAIRLLEQTWVPETRRPDDVTTARDLLERVDLALRDRRAPVATGWRWRILLLRARIDVERATHPGETTNALDAAYEELIRIYHAATAGNPVAPRSRAALARLHAAQATVVPEHMQTGKD